VLVILVASLCCFLTECQCLMRGDDAVTRRGRERQSEHPELEHDDLLELALANWQRQQRVPIDAPATIRDSWSRTGRQQPPTAAAAGGPRVERATAQGAARAQGFLVPSPSRSRDILPGDLLFPALQARAWLAQAPLSVQQELQAALEPASLPQPSRRPQRGHPSEDLLHV